MRKLWLKDWPWVTVVTINAGLCQEKKALHKPTSEGYKPAKKLWKKSCKRELTLREALEIGRRCHKLSPFLLLQRKHLRRDWSNHHSGHQVASRQSAQLPQRGGTLHCRHDRE
jgi:hypothetical protein